MKKPDNFVPCHDGSRFTWDKDGNGSAEASQFANRTYWTRIWNDSIDVGFYVISARTGVKKLFTFAGSEFFEGELKYDVYVSECNKHQITVFND